MKTRIRQSGWPTPVVNHLVPLTTTSSPSRVAVASMLVASEEATAGSVIAKPERIRPSSRGTSHSCCCSGVPYLSRTSMLPVSGALQLKTYGARNVARPICSASGA